MERRQYEPPTIVRLGTVEELSQGVGFGPPDADGDGNEFVDTGGS